VAATRLLALIPLGLWLAGGLPAAAQDGREPIPQEDPYTRGDERAMEEAGYLSFGPFLWGDGHTTEQLAESLGGVPVIFVETAHFRIASSLDTYLVGEDRVERAILREELERLAERVPRVKPRERELDPWLRLHLWAQRLEELYTAFGQAFGLEPDLFPAEPLARRPGEPLTPEQLGAGPHLGLHQKFTVLLTQKTSTLARYSAAHLDRSVDTPYRYFFSDLDSYHYCTSFELMGEVYGNEVAFHCAVTYGVTQNLVNGFAGYTHSAPVWFRHGVARWFTRQVDPRWMVYAVGPGELGRTEEDAEWEPKVRARVKNDYWPTMAELVARSDESTLKFQDHLMLWSRVDWMLRAEPEAAGRFLRAAMAPNPWGQGQDRAALEQARFDEALEAAFGPLEELDEAWTRWVLKEYER
jgi:hypothetical protein